MPNNQKMFVVGIGASAGGLEPIRSFVSKLEPTPNMVYIIAQHMSAEHPCKLTSLLNQSSSLTAVKAETGLQLTANTIYVLPYISEVSFTNNKIILQQANSTTQPPRPSIDQFFNSLATTYKDHAIGVIFSGSGIDGAQGCKAIKAAGGITIAQPAYSATFDSMPKAALQLANVDLLLTPDQTASKLIELAKNPQLLTLTELSDISLETSQDIIEQILKQTGIDFLNYKPTTINRQIQRRMALLHIDTIKNYGQYIKDNPNEPTQLANNFLICVTSFFRDQESYQSLKLALQSVIKRKNIGDEIRVWVPGCATGEEAFSIAMLLAEELGSLSSRYRIQIFGTDINPHSIQFARKGMYNEASLDKLSKPLRDKYFVYHKQVITVSKTLRDMTIFSQHNLLKDPPFIRMDLISCRNLLIYLNPASQQRILKNFHYGLVSNGLLFLGRSETIGNLADAFSEFNKKNKLYIKRNCQSFQPELNTRTLTQLDINHESLPLINKEVEYRHLGEQKIVEIYAKPTILATHHGKILEFYNDCSPFIKVKPGTADFNLFSILDPLLKTELKSLLHRAFNSKETITSQAVPLFFEEKEQFCRLSFNLIDNPRAQEQLLLISFEKILNVKNNNINSKENESETLINLRHELSIRRETLHTVTEALETSIYELQSLNEETQVSNEELQSTNEELETSNEELQSTIEELTVVNDELADKTTALEEINDDFENVLNSIQKAVLVIDDNLNINQFNETSKQFFNFEISKDKVLNLSSIDIFFNADTLIEHIKQVIKTGVVFKETLMHQNHHYELMFYPYLNKRSKVVTGVVMTIMDITASKNAEQQISTAAKVFEAASEGIVITDADQRIITVNAAFTKISGYSEKEVIGKTPHVISSNRHDKAFYKDMWRSINTAGEWQGEIWNKRKNGDVYPEWLSISRLNNKKDEANGYIGIFSDITKLVEAQKTIQQQINFDSLTQLPNRQLFFDRLQQAMTQAKRQNKLIGVMFIDLDGFKVINDSLGHSQGDIVLQQIAERMLDVSRETDTFARFGGDEFTCLVANMDSETDIIPLVEKLLQAIEEPIIVNSIKLNITASIGIAIYPTNSDDAETLIQHADNAMYKAKAEGRNSYQFFTAKMHDQVLNHHRMGNDIKYAVKHNKFQIYYQPVIALATQQIIGAEALIRWDHPTKGFISPEIFIPIAEELNLITEIGEFVLAHACQFIAKLNKEQLQPLHIAINFSNQQFLHESCVENSLKIINTSQVGSENVIIEITESLMMSNKQHYIEQLNHLRKNGIKIAMDDFGTGYSSLSYLKKLPIDILKIDKTFIRDILTDESDASLVETILDIASNFKLNVVAEGVEQKEHAEFLTQRNCLFAQGFYFSKAVPEQEFIKLVKPATQ